ncbi:MAG: phosphopantothenoylcysteine decarboxylase [Caldilineaceae bacterium]
MSEPLTLLGHIRQLLAQGGPLAGKRVVVTAGGTREAVDPVRYLTNHSSGKQGYAVAQPRSTPGRKWCSSRRRRGCRCRLGHSSWRLTVRKRCSMRFWTPVAPPMR